MPIDHLERGFGQIPWFLEHKFWLMSGAYVYATPC